MLQPWGMLCLLLVLAAAMASSQPAVEYTTEVMWQAEEPARAILAPHAQTAFESDDAPPPASLLHLQRRAERNADYFRQAMRSLAFYDGAVEAETDQTTEPPTLRYTLTPGPRYTFAEAQVIPAEGANPAPLEHIQSLPVETGAPATADKIRAAGGAVLKSLRHAGHPFARMTDQAAVVDHATRRVRLTVTVDPGPHAMLGPVAVEGVERTKRVVVTRDAPWETGDSFNPGLLETYQTRLYRTNLFSVVRVDTADSLDENGRLPVTVTVTERKQRTIALGLRYYTDDGAGARVRWEDRNRRGLGHKLDTALDLGTRRLGLGGGYRVPHFRRGDQQLVFDFDIAQEDTDAYTSQLARAEVDVERQMTERLILGLGAGLRLSQVERGDEDKESFTFLYFPGQLHFDRANARLSPTEGYRLQLEMAPYLNFTGVADSFMKAATTLSGYMPLDAEDTWVIAGRLGLGMTGGTDLERIPADLRYYAGGGGSVRGYGYQMAGPLDDNDNPIGGRSRLQSAAELRYRLNETIGLAAFLDGGTVYDSVWPDFSATMRWGAGFGLRYYTPLGPFRIDVAVPLNKRSADSSMQFYLSVGQAF